MIRQAIRPTRVVESNLLTMGACSAAGDKRQAIPPKPTIPPPEVCKLRAKITAEEAFETIEALGFQVILEVQGQRFAVNPETITFLPLKAGPDMEGIIDGCCDATYVAVGTMLACGVDPDLHLEHVCDCNDAKFPGGKAIIRQEDGKFQKPEGWVPPNHTALMEGEVCNMGNISRIYVHAERPSGKYFEDDYDRHVESTRETT